MSLLDARGVLGSNAGLAGLGEESVVRGDGGVVSEDAVAPVWLVP